MSRLRVAVVALALATGLLPAVAAPAFALPGDDSTVFVNELLPASQVGVGRTGDLDGLTGVGARAVVESVRAPSGTTFHEESLTWSIPTLGAGEELELTLRFRTRPPIGGTLTLDAEVEAEDNDDPNSDNDSDADTVVIRPVPGRGPPPR